MSGHEEQPTPAGRPSYYKKLRTTFPYFLVPGEEGSPAWTREMERQEKWRRIVAKKLREADVPHEQVTVKLAGKGIRVGKNIVAAIEQGELEVPLGLLYEITAVGYSVDLDDLLLALYEDVRNEIEGDRIDDKSLFERPDHYALYWHSTPEHHATPLLLGGDFKKFVWAVPLRRIKGQPMSTSLLELAARRDRLADGSIPYHTHGGAEVITPLFGSIDVTISDTEAAEPAPRILKPGDAIHMVSRYHHKIRNHGGSSTALMLVIRSHDQRSDSSRAVESKPVENLVRSGKKAGLTRKKAMARPAARPK